MLSIFLLFSSVLCQKQETKNTRELLIWQQRVDELTNGIFNDSKSVDDSERTFYLALLAKMWWKVDSAEAHRFLKKASDLMLRDVELDDTIDLSKKIKYSQKTLQIIASLDEQLSQSLTEKIAKILETKGNGDKANADSFVMIGLQIVEKNPQLGYALGVKSLNYGYAERLHALILKLNFKDSILAEGLFQLALAAVRRNFGYQSAGGLGIIVFEVRDGKTFSDTARRSYLELLAEMISAATLSEPDRATRCEILPLLTERLDKFDEYLPNLALTVRQQVQLCLPFVTGYTAGITKAETGDNGPQTADEFIRAARDTNDRGLKVHYFHRAIEKLNDMKKFEDIVSLLDDMTEDERNFIRNDIWEEFRADYASKLALVYFENKDLPAVYRVIDRTPKRIRPYTRFRIAYKISPVKDRGFYLENLEGIRKELDSIEVNAKDAASNYLTLAGLYLKIQPTESESIFRNAVKYINKTDDENPDFLPEKDWAPLQDYESLSSELLETDESSIQGSLKTISSRRSRIRLKLGLLESTLQRLEKVKKDVELEKKVLRTRMPNQ
ncbi:MAG TPA: hypothetical protein PLD38_14655 [Pyrinomonadaceae bacterium]|nr:hypothetical protein [Chloracidobacterium sp.]MBK9437294.1 hypothetical protein [Chloracidobacterium sp.]MBL0239967.1 hypothetical protein [Chloracidobacterium sp.]HQY68516.1 hypothetical protein [Pyrinomonadaceae bacterium]